MTSKSRRDKTIYIIYTGGTIGMHKSEHGYTIERGYLAQLMAKVYELMLPEMPNYVVHEYAELIDSSNATPALWEQIGRDIIANYDKYDGFVVLHGTDTMAYSASALSFMLENLNKPVIFTGSQIPLGEIRTDARNNLINAMLIASDYQIPEVCLYFNNVLLRGNRSKKIDSNSFGAFDSPNFPPLGKAGTGFTLRKHAILLTAKDKINLQTLSEPSIAQLNLFPGMSLDMLQTILALPLQGLVLGTYGLGNAPTTPDFLRIIEQATRRGIIIVNCSQCLYAKVDMRSYVAGSGLAKAGVLSAGDMTYEAALTKLFYLFSKKLSVLEIKRLFCENLRGELTVGEII